MDNFCGLGGFVAAGDRYFLHDGRVHPPAVGPGGRGPADSGAARPQRG